MITKKHASPRSSKLKEAKPSAAEHQTRLEILQSLALKTGLKRSEVSSVFQAMAALVKGHLKKKGSGEILLPMLGIKLRRVRRNPTKKRVMHSTLTGTDVVIPAKPARDDIKVIALKGLKESLLKG